MSTSAGMPPGRKALPPLDPKGSARRGAMGGPFGWSVRLAARSAFTSLGAHKLRAALTLIGIVVGVAGLSVIVNVGLLVQAANAQAIGGLGASVVDVQGFTPPASAPPAGIGLGGAHVEVSPGSGGPSLTVADVQALRNLRHVVGATPLMGNELTIQAGGHHSSTQVTGAYPDIQIAERYSVQQGAFFSQSDVVAAKTVAVLGQTAATQLFPGGSAVGQQVRIGSVDFSVVGVVKRLGGNGLQDLDSFVVVPSSTFLQRLTPPPQESNLDDLLVAVDDPANVQTVTSAITHTLEQSHGIKSGSPDDFAVFGYLTAQAAAQRSAETLQWIMGAVACVALLIGGFGVVNVMLATIAERRQEIGVRLAVGASVEDVFWQFLVEALTVSAVGGLLGALGGIALSVGLPRLTGAPDSVHITPSWLAVVVALATAIVIGLIFGAYPARRAAQTDPIRALRRA